MFIEFSPFCQSKSRVGTTCKCDPPYPVKNEGHVQVTALLILQMHQLSWIMMLASLYRLQWEKKDVVNACPGATRKKRPY